MPDFRLVIVATHPIQHFVSLYRALSRVSGLDVTVLFGSRQGLERYFDVEMNCEIAWNMDLLSGYDSRFLGAEADEPSNHVGKVSPPALRAALEEIAPDAIITYGYATRLSRVATAIGRSLGARMLMIGDSELLDPRPLHKRLLKRLALPLFYRRIDAFLTVGDENERYYRHYGVSPRRLFRSPYPIDEATFRAAAQQRPDHRRQLLERLGIDGNPLLALCVGKMSPRKRPGDLLDAVEQLIGKTARPVHAVLAGNGILLDDLRAAAAARAIPAHLLGFVNVDELPAIYAACDVIVHPSGADPHPLICSEASCVGLPLLLSSRVGAAGPTDVARPGRNAIVFPVGNINALADALRSLADDPARIEQMGRDGRAIFDELDMRRSVSGVIEALRSCGWTGPA